MKDTEQQDWEATAKEWQQTNSQVLWRRHSDAVNLALLRKWWPGDGAQNVLKTDLFDELVGEGLIPFLRSRVESVGGLDLSQAVAFEARKSFPDVQAIVADVRKLPYPIDQFDLIVSNSTLDHFQETGDINRALDELYRVLRPGGQMILTLDNLRNPLIALRHILPFRIMKALGIVPYFVGATLGPRGLRKAAEKAGFKVLEATSVIHCPRVFAVAIAGRLQRHATEAGQKKYLRGLMSFEQLARLPTRYFTGHFVAVRLVK